MTYITFENTGLIDLRSIKTFGVSVKENDSPIGYFGTGLKYAIAIALREGEMIGLLHGKHHYLFESIPSIIRNKEFKLIQMGADELSFTTELGKNWEFWMAFRELYCNTLDEGGTVRLEKGFPQPKENSTIFYLSGAKSELCYNQKSVYFLETSPILKDDSVEIHAGRNAGIFYRGIFVKKLINENSLFTYNITKQISLTEDRTAKWNFEITEPIRDMFLKTHDQEFLYEALTAPRGSFENRLSFSDASPGNMGEAFNEVCLRLRNYRGKDVNVSALHLWEKAHRRSIIKDAEVETSNLENMMLKKAIHFCTVVGFPINEYPISVHKSLGGGILGEAHKGTILLSQEAFKIGTKMVAETLIEEYIHLRYGHEDMTRSMQSMLFNTIVNLAEEHILKEPL